MQEIKSNRIFDSENCVFKNDCIKFNTPDCKDPCWRQREYFWLLDNSNLPEKHKEDIKLMAAKEDLKIFEYLNYIKENIKEFVDEGYNLVIQGGSGCGKTSWATKFIRQYIIDVAISNKFVQRALFINFPWFIAQLKQNITQNQKEFKEIHKIMPIIDLLILDDIGATSLTNDFIHNEIYSIINTRIDEGRSVIYTTNLSDSELSENLGARLSSRIIGASETVLIKNKLNLRHPNANFSFKDFIEGNLKNSKE